ncbi:MAG: right-handed parallel beta-helix repeat-containing protein [Promethearchaeota archaeon]
MKSKQKTFTLILILLGIFSAFSPIYFNNQRFTAKHHDITSNYNNQFYHDNLKISASSGKIHINNNWTAAKAAGICVGSGTYSDPYLIRDLIIDGDDSDSCILIENSEVFFEIENCSVFNSYFGIKLTNTENAWILNNNCSSNKFYGISLSHSTNNTISGNIVNNNNYWGIHLFYSDKNNILENTERNNLHYGIALSDSDNNLILKNIVNTGINLDGLYNNITANLMNKCGLRIYSDTENFYSQYIDTTNLVNGKPLYYYTNEINLGPTNFTNAGQVILASCGNLLVANLNLSYTDTGISLINCHDNFIIGNTMNNNQREGIFIFGGDNNTISENSVSYNNQDGVFLELSSNNSFLENNVSYNNFNGFNCYSLENSFISENNINHNQKYGIYFINCKNNTITGNSLIGNEKCFKESYSEGNIFENNECRDRKTSIPGYSLYLLIGILFTLVIIYSKKSEKIL